MDHDQAIETQASMRYVLGELLPAERDSFEEHYADCSQCMNDVELATAFAVNSKEVFRERALAGDAPKGIPWWRWRPFPVLALSAALNLILVAGLGIGFLRLRQAAPQAPPVESVSLSQPESVDVIPVRGTTRGGTGSAQVVRASLRPIVLSFDLPQRYEHYFYSIDRAGQVVMSGELSVSDQEAVNLEIPVARLSPGEYHVSVDGTVGSTRENLGSCVLQEQGR